MKLTTAFIIGVFTIGSSYSLADHRHQDSHWKHDHHKYSQADRHYRKAARHERKARKHHRAARHHEKAVRHERKASKHRRIAKRHERLAHHKHHDNYRSDRYRDTRFRHDRDGYGRVMSVTPVYRSVSVPVRDDSCVNYDRSRPNYSSHTATVLGAVIGGALGHRIGDSHGDPEVAAIAGGLIGASVGRDLDRRATYNRNLRVEGPCRVKQRYETRRELVEYKVSYRYNGEVHRARMDYDPGEWVKLDVDVSPA